MLIRGAAVGRVQYVPEGYGNGYSVKGRKLSRRFQGSLRIRAWFPRVGTLG